MYKVFINFFYWLLIKSEESANSSSSLEVEAASNKIVLFSFRGSYKYVLKKYNLTPMKIAQIGHLSIDLQRS